MKKTIALFLFLIATISTFSQTTNGNEIIAEGISKTKVKPDLANFRITVEKKNLEEKIAIKELNEEVEKLQKVFLKIGFTTKNIKISNYKVYSEENGDNKKEFAVTNTLLIDFALDNKVIDAFYQEIQNESIKDVEIEFETQISEELEKTTRQKLVQLAIADARSNGENIAKALDVKIINVKQVSKLNLRDFAAASMKVDELKFKKSGHAAMDANPKTSFDNYEVEEKELEETITIVYEIVKK